MRNLTNPVTALNPLFTKLGLTLQNKHMKVITKTITEYANHYESLGVNVAVYYLYVVPVAIENAIDCTEDYLSSPDSFEWLELDNKEDVFVKMFTTTLDGVDVSEYMN